MLGERPQFVRARVAHVSHTARRQSAKPCVQESGAERGERREREREREGVIGARQEKTTAGRSVGRSVRNGERRGAGGKELQ